MVLFPLPWEWKEAESSDSAQVALSEKWWCKAGQQLSRLPIALIIRGDSEQEWSQVLVSHVRQPRIAKVSRFSRFI